MKEDFAEFFSKFKDQIKAKKPVLFDENGKLVGFVSYSKPHGQNEGYDCPIEQEESLKDRLRRVSKPKLIIEESED